MLPSRIVMLASALLILALQFVTEETGSAIFPARIMIGVSPFVII
jgi:hypothetical protein